MGRAALAAMFALGALALSPPAHEPDASAPTGLRLCAGPFPFRDPLLLLAPVLFGAPPEYTGPDASAQTVPSCASDIREQRPFPGHARVSFRLRIPDAHHLDDHHRLHRRRNREIHHARRQRAIGIYLDDNPWRRGSFCRYLSRSSNWLVPSGRRGRSHRRNCRGRDLTRHLGLHCWSPSLGLKRQLHGRELVCRAKF